MAGKTILDVYVYYPREEGVRRFFDPVRFGVEPGDLLSQNGAVNVFQALQGLKKIFRGRPVIMHDDIYGVVNLGQLAYRHLGKNIAASFHSPAEDAQATGELWVKATGYNRAAEFQQYQKKLEAQRQAQKKAAEAKMAAKKAICQQKVQEATAKKAADEAKKTGSSNREVILDVYVRYPQQAGLVQRCDPPEFGVEFDDLRASNGAVPADWAINCMKQLFHGHPIIMHGNTNDMLAFGDRVDQVFTHSTVIDTQDLYGQVRFKTLCAEVLQKPIQQGYHSSVEDARATMALWIKHADYDRSGPLRAHMEVMAQRAAVKKAEEEKVAARKAAFKEAAAQRAAERATAAALKKQAFQKSDTPDTRAAPSRLVAKQVGFTCLQALRQ
ncbi:putative ribonuclease H-like superfamily [Septoria linicola]|nr:putative ribonuclease H-like superfamily [Septoria linicola]